MSGIALGLVAAGGGVSVSASPPIGSGGAIAGGAVPPVTAIGAGFPAAPTFAWTVIVPDPDFPLVIGSPASATTGFTFSFVSTGDVATATVRVTATSGGLSAFCDVVVTFRNTSRVGLDRR